MLKRKILNIGSTPDPNCEALKDALKIKKEQRKNLGNELKKNNDAKNENQADLKAVKGYIAIEKKQKSDLEALNSKIDAKINANKTWLKNHQNAATAVKQALRNQNKQLNNSKKENITTINLLENRLKLREEVIPKIEKQIEELQKTIDEINKDIAKKDAEITKLNNQIKAAGCK